MVEKHELGDWIEKVELSHRRKSEPDLRKTKQHFSKSPYSMAFMVQISPKYFHLLETENRLTKHTIIEQSRLQSE